MPRLVLLSKLCERLFAFAELSAPCRSRHENLLFLTLTETLRLAHIEEEEDYGDCSDAPKDEEGA